jgi:hypothetical protein
VTSNHSSDNVEPQTTLADVIHVRREADLDGIAAKLVTLLADTATIVDISRYDRRADTIEIRITSS